MPYFARVLPKAAIVDHHGQALEKTWQQSGLGNVSSLRVGKIYFLNGHRLTAEDAKRLAEKLLADPISEDYVLDDKMSSTPAHSVMTIWPKPGVTDPVAQTVLIGAKDIKIFSLEDVRAGTLYAFPKGTPAKALRRFGEDYLMNPLVQDMEMVG